MVHAPLLVYRMTTGDDFFFLLKIFAQLLCIAGDTYCPRNFNYLLLPRQGGGMSKI